jgi:hypothetical protein
MPDSILPLVAVAQTMRGVVRARCSILYASDVEVDEAIGYVPRPTVNDYYWVGHFSRLFVGLGYNKVWRLCCLLSEYGVEFVILELLTGSALLVDELPIGDVESGFEDGILLDRFDPTLVGDIHHIGKNGVR